MKGNEMKITDEMLVAIANGEMEMDSEIFDALYEHYLPEMPYGTAKGRTGDPYEWISDRIEFEYGSAR
jgi:hypothetical protein